MVRTFVVSVSAIIAALTASFFSPPAPSDHVEVAGVSLSDGSYPSFGEDQGALSIKAEQLRIDEILAEAARVKAELDAVNALRIGLEGRTGVDWNGIATCETGGDWSHRGAAPGGSHYEGGVGFLHAAWIDFGGMDFAAHADEATREEQIIVAERLYDEHGLSGWGCKEYG